jgi:hypothetical protein
MALTSECAPLPRTGGGAHSPAGEGWGSPNYDDWRKSLALCLLCGFRTGRYAELHCRKTSRDQQPVHIPKIQELEDWRTASIRTT